MTRARTALALLLLASWSGIARTDDWVEVRSPHFQVIGNAGTRRTRDTAAELERIRLVFGNALVHMPQEPRLPIVAFVVRDEEGFRELLPEYWEHEGPKPGGIFHRGPDKHFIVLRLDASFDERYRIIYHEYFHLLMALNTRRLPVWLNEGLAEFWGTTRFRGSGVLMGMANAQHLDRCRRQNMMPLRDLLAITVNPHVSDPDRVGIFYAESWALTHLLMLGDGKGGGAGTLGTFIGRVEEGADPQKTFVSLFGELDAMEEKLARYVRRGRFLELKMEAPEKIDEDSFRSTELSEANADALRGNFLVGDTRPDAALPLLERALELDANDGLALESMGFYYYRKQDYEKAKEWFSKATGVDSQSFLCYYYLARILMSDASGADERVMENLRRTIGLNPNFAPAYADLGNLYASSGVRLESAYGLAFKAAEIEPDNASYWINLGRILLRMQKPAEARAAASTASSVARTEGMRRMAERLEREIEAQEEHVISEARPDAQVPESLDGRRRGLREGDLRVEGVFVELRCGKQSGTFDFVVESSGRRYLLHTDAPGTIQVVQSGKRVDRELNCGPQDASVIAIYTPSTESTEEESSEVRGELRVLEFLP